MPGRITSGGVRLLHVLVREGAYLDLTPKGWIIMPDGRKARPQVAEYLLGLGLLEPYHKGVRGWTLNEAGKRCAVTHRRPTSSG